MSISAFRRFCGVTALAAALCCGLTAAPLGASERDGVRACPIPGGDGARPTVREGVQRRLRATLADDAGRNDADADLESLAFVTSARPNPQLREITQTPGEDGTRLEITVVNNSRHPSPDGGITLSFPALTRPSDRDRITNVEVPDGMALHVIAAGGDLFGRNGARRVARHLMIEVHGAWNPRQERTLKLDLMDIDSQVLVRYRSALSDENGDYRNAPTRSPVLDQQGWPALACLAGSERPGLAQQQDPRVDGLDDGGQP